MAIDLDGDRFDSSIDAGATSIGASIGEGFDSGIDAGVTSIDLNAATQGENPVRDTVYPISARVGIG